MALKLSSCANALFIYSFLTIVLQSDIHSAQPQIGLGEFETCSLWFGEVRCWGNIENITDPYVPPTVPYKNFGGNFIPEKLLVGLVHGCLISNMGKVRCFGANHYGQLGIEQDCAFPYGSVLKQVDLGEGFIVEDGDVGGQHSCFISTEHDLKCFGRNHWGQLGYGDRENRGDEKGEMGDNLLAVQLGDDFVPKQVACGASNNCVLSMTFAVKCFGANADGALGYGDTNSRGNNGGEMGNNLDVVDLGDFTPIRLFAGGSSACALSEEGTAKCWGKNDRGRLGMGHLNNVGDQPDQMGDNLPLMNFGDDFVITDLFCGRRQICGGSTTAGAKCYGSNYLAQLGQGDRVNKGGTPETAGDNLPVIDLGSDFTFSKFAVGGTHSYHICAVSTDDTVKCWGHNAKGQLGLGTNQALMGDRPQEMGDGLPYVNLPVNYPTAAPTASPTDVPTQSQNPNGGNQQNGGPGNSGNSANFPIGQGQNGPGQGPPGQGGPGVNMPGPGHNGPGGNGPPGHFPAEQEGTDNMEPEWNDAPKSVDAKWHLKLFGQGAVSLTTYIVYLCGLLMMINMICCAMYCYNKRFGSHKQYNVVGFDNSDTGNETDIDLDNVKCVQ